jgi:hypothetical protein
MGDRPFAIVSTDSDWQGLFTRDKRTEWRSHPSEPAIASTLAINPFCPAESPESIRCLTNQDGDRRLLLKRLMGKGGGDLGAIAEGHNTRCFLFSKCFK